MDKEEIELAEQVARPSLIEAVHKFREEVDCSLFTVEIHDAVVNKIEEIERLIGMRP